MAVLYLTWVLLPILLPKLLPSVHFTTTPSPVNGVWVGGMTLQIGRKTRKSPILLIFHGVWARKLGRNETYILGLTYGEETLFPIGVSMEMRNRIVSIAFWNLWGRGN